VIALALSCVGFGQAPMRKKNAYPGVGGKSRDFGLGQTPFRHFVASSSPIPKRSHHQRQHETFDVMHSRANDRRSAPKCQGKWPDQTLDQAFGLPEVLVAVSTSRLSCKRAGKTRTLMPVWDPSGESRLRPLTSNGLPISRQMTTHNR